MGKKKRIVDAENHLLLGGIATGFFAFMGATPFAAVSAGVTGALVGKDIKKGKKEEQFKRDFAAHQEKYKDKMIEIDRQRYKIREELEYMCYYDFDPLSPKFILQEQLENIFKNGQIIEQDSIPNLKNNGKGITSIDDFINIAKNARDDEKILEINDGLPSYFIVKTETSCVYTCLGLHDCVPYNLRAKCQKYNIELKKYTYEQMNRIMGQISQQLYKPYQFDYSKYQ